MSEIITSIFGNGDLAMYIEAILSTIIVTLISTAFAYLIGIPIGIILYCTGEGGIFENKIANFIIGFIVNVIRSIPFIVLLVLTQPIAKFIVGTKLGDKAFIFYLIVASAPFVARMIESSLKEIDKGVIEAAQSMGASNFQIIMKVLLPEAKPSLTVGCAIALTTILGYTPMTYLIGGGGLGKLAIQYGIYKFDKKIMYISSLLLIVIVQIVQEVFNYISKKTDKRKK